MKKKLFISYADNDMTKVNLIKRVLKDNNTFEPIIVADRRHPLQLLTEKVISGIKESDYVIPILTGKSIKEQWINQEIGYSFGINKTVMPIVEQSTMNKLKGFIHKQSDLSHNFKKHKNLGQENKYFKNCFLTLIGDIEMQIDMPVKNKLVTEDEISKVPYSNLHLAVNIATRSGTKP